MKTRDCLVVLLVVAFCCSMVNAGVVDVSSSDNGISWTAGAEELSDIYLNGLGHWTGHGIPEIYVMAVEGGGITYAYSFGGDFSPAGTYLAAHEFTCLTWINRRSQFLASNADGGVSIVYTPDSGVNWYKSGLYLPGVNFTGIAYDSVRSNNDAEYYMGTLADGGIRPFIYYTYNGSWVIGGTYQPDENYTGIANTAGNIFVTTRADGGINEIYSFDNGATWGKGAAHLTDIDFTGIARNPYVGNKTYLATTVPEPVTLVMLSLGSLVALRRKEKK